MALEETYCDAGAVTTATEQQQLAIARALASPLPYLVDVRIDGSENVWKAPI